MTRLLHVALSLVLAAAAMLTLAGCAGDGKAARQQPQPTCETSATEGTAGDSLPNSGRSALLDAFENVESFMDARQTDRPVKAAIGQPVAVTGRLTCAVLAVEDGPYDCVRGHATKKVRVAMENTSDRVVMVKPSNWNADATSGERLDHVYAVYGESGDVAASSFSPTTKISPGKVLEADVYFVADSLDNVIYEPHWLVSSENQLAFWDVRKG